MLRTQQTFKEGRKRVTIQYMPAGESVIDATVNGVPARRTVRVDGKTAARLQEDLEAAHARSAAGKAAAPCGYFDHRSGPASFRPVRFIDGGARGVLLEVELTEAGRKALEGGDYGYFSPNFRRDKATGEVLGLRADTVEVGSLVNDPAFQTIEQIAAARANAEEEDAEGEENVSTARPLAFTKECPNGDCKKKKPAAPEPEEEDGEEEPEEEQKPAPKGKAPATHIPPAVAKDIEETTEENGRAFLKEWKNRKKKPARKEETAAASRTFLQAWGQHQAEQVAAANPYGCNQYGEGWKKPHNGVFRQRKGESGGSSEREAYAKETQEEEPQEETSPEMEGSEKQKKWAEDILNKGVDDAVKAGGSFIGGELRRELQEKHGIDLAKLTREQAQAILDMLVDPQKKQLSREKLKAIVDKWKGGKKAGDIINSGSRGGVIRAGNWKLTERSGEPIKPVTTATAQAIADMLKQKSEHVSAKRHKNRNTSGKVSGNCPRHEQGLPCKRHDKKPTGKNTWDRTKEGRAAHEEWRKQNAIVEELERDLRRK